jgi:molybdopterin molybdotransferase
MTALSPPQRLPAALTPLEVALAALCHGLDPVAPVELALAQALGCVAADQAALPALPRTDIAVANGWALRARDLVGASSYAPLPLANAPVWVEAGDRMPEACDCVIDSAWVEQAGPVFEASAEAIPGQGVRRIGGDITEASAVIAAGRPIRPLDLLIVRTAGLQRLKVRRPRLRIVNIPAISGQTATAELIVESAGAAGADTVCAEATGRDVASIAAALDAGGCDLLVSIGGSGVGRTDAAVLALARCGEVVAHGMALQPGRTAAVGRIAAVPVVALPGAADQALAAWWTVVLPVLDRLSARLPRAPVTLALARKIASSVGIADIVLLEARQGAWMPLAVGDLSLDAIGRADAWLAVPGGSEGYAAGAAVDAYMLRE